jgi:hypothetical protein
LRSIKPARTRPLHAGGLQNERGDDVDFMERLDGVYRLKATASRADGGYCASLVIERERRGCTEQAYREDCIDGARVFDDPLVALTHALDRGWTIIHRQPSRLAC